MNDTIDISTLSATTAQPASVMVLTQSGALAPVSFDRLCDLVGVNQGSVGVRNYCALSRITSFKNATRDGFAIKQTTADTAPLRLAVQLHKSSNRYDSGVIGEKMVWLTTVTAGHIKKTFTIPEGTDYEEMQIKFNGSARDTGFYFPMTETGTFTVELDIPTTVQGEVEMRNISVHRGTASVDWVPAWEDVAALAASVQGASMMSASVQGAESNPEPLAE